MSDNLSIAGRIVALDEVTIDGTIVLVPLDKVGFGDEGQYTSVKDADGARMPVSDPVAAGKLDTVIAALTTVEGYTDQLESLLTALGANTDQLEGLLAPATPTNLPGASGAVTGSTGTLMGYTARETSGTATAFFRLRAGSVTGAILATETLAAGESTRDWYGPSGILATSGVYFELVSGAVAGGVQTR